eukprot:g5386.t1
MLFEQPPRTDLKGSTEGKVEPGFPTESVREFEDSSPTSTSPILVRRISLDDKAKLKAFSIENDSAGWLKKKLFKKEVTWPRDLYLNVLGCKALVPHASTSTDGPLTATASVTTDGENGNVNSPAENDPPPGGALGAAGDLVAGESPEMLESGESGGGGEDTESSVGTGVEEVDETMNGISSSAEDEDGQRPEEIKGECFVRIHNATTGRDLQTETIQGGANPAFHETFVVPCQGPRDAVVLEVFFGEGEKALSIGEAALPLDARVVGVSHPVLLSVKDKQGRSRGFLRVETFWLDEAKPRKETGEFYYKVVHPCGVSLRNEPCTGSDRTVHVLGYGEVFVACERQWHVGADSGDGDGSPVFVKVMTAKDRWNRSGWCFETLSGKDGRSSVPVLERTSSPLRESGRYFYRVCNAEGARLYRKADPKSKLQEELFPEGQVLEASHKWTPAGSPVTFVTMVNRSGFIIQKCGEKVVVNDAGEAAFEEVDCPKSTLISSVGVPEPPPAPTASAEAAAVAVAAARDAGDSGDTAGSRGIGGTQTCPSSSPTKQGRSSSPSKQRNSKVDKKKAAEAAAVAASVRRLYRVREESGVEATRTPDIVAPAVDHIEAGTAFYGKAEVVKHYEGIGEVAFVMRETDELWVRANRPGLALMLDVFTNAVEFGAFTYRVSHENGVVVRTAPGLDAPAIKPRRILPVNKLVNVCERLTRAEDILALSRPPTFLRLAGNDGWVFDRRGHTLVCEDVTVKSRIATANAITSEAARLSLGGLA